MTHHGRPGGRTLELIVLFALIAATGCLLYWGVKVGVSLARWGMEVGLVPYGGRKFSAMMLLILFSVSPLISVLFLWKLWYWFLKFYKYDPRSLKPILEREDKT